MRLDSSFQTSSLGSAAPATPTSLTLKAHRKFILLSLDIQSAYDRVWHAGLLKKLGDADVPLALVGWIGAFLRDWQASLRVGTTSISQSLTVGVP